MLRLRWLGLLCFLALNGAACSGASGSMPDAGSQDGARSPDGASSPEDASSPEAPPICMGPLQEVSAGCQATYDGTKAPVCARGIQGGWIQRCNGLVTLTYYLPAFQLWCSYDETSHALVGAAELGDSDTYCNGTSPDLWAGRAIENTCLPSDMNKALSCVPADAGSN